MVGRLRSWDVAFALVLAVAGLGLDAEAAANPVVKLGNAGVQQGRTTLLDVSLESTTARYAGLNLAVALPAGVTCVGVEPGAALAQPTAFLLDSASFVEDAVNKARALVYSTTQTFGQGVVLRLTLQADRNAPLGGPYAVTFDGPVKAVASGGAAHALAAVSGDTAASVQHDAANGAITILPPTVLTLTSATPSAALVVGGSPLTLHGYYFNENCAVYVNNRPCARVTFAKETQTLTCAAPPGEPGPAIVRVEDAFARVADERNDVLVYTADPFAGGLDTTAGVARTWQEGQVTTLHGYIPGAGSLVLAASVGEIDFTTVTIPAELRQGYDAGFVVVRTAESLATLYPTETVRLPLGYAPVTFVFDIGGLVLDNATAYEIDEPFATAVLAQFLVMATQADESLRLGFAETHLDENLAPVFALVPGAQPALQVTGEPPTAVDPGANTVTFSVYDFTTYVGLGPHNPTDINADGDIDALDVQLVINSVLGIPSGFDCDVNGDGSPDAIDIQLEINAVLGVS